MKPYGKLYNDSTYRVVVSTLSDSSSTSDGLYDYRVIANMDEGNFESIEFIEGESIDNINPSTPEITGYSSGEDNNINISWF